ncbi:MAG TPA: glycoside hydrolase 43 family protein [Polyangiaceae bacterium]|nr:glycoside hydrolase 43 family protein [Polyangiaceae bacterium]
MSVTAPNDSPGIGLPAQSGGAPNDGAAGAAPVGPGLADGGAGMAVEGQGGDGAEGTPTPPATCATTYTNPLIWEDLPDLEVIRVDDTYYYTASTFHHSPGAPLLSSTDLVHWKYVGHSVPALDFTAAYRLEDGRAYVDGIWASSLRYRQSNHTFYWIGCLHNGGGGYVFTAESAAGPWTKHSSQGCYYDVGLLIDDDDSMYVAYGNNTLNVAKLTADGFGEQESHEVFTTPDDVGGPLEGSRFYKIDGNYYIFTTQYANGEYVLRSTDGPFGPYELRPFAVRVPFGGSGAGASPHQGGIVETQNGDWYYLGFNDSYPAGRLPVMAPMTWSDGWPSLTLSDGKWGAEYPFPNLPCGAANAEAMPRVDTFSGATLGPEWEWNHAPDDSKWAIGDGLTLQAATVTGDLYAARNTLTRRMVGPTSTATIELDYSGMQDGDVAGLAAFRDSTAWIGVERDAEAYRVVAVDGLTLDSSWATSSAGSESAAEDISGGMIWLRVEANIRTDAGGGKAKFSYSADGTEFTPLGETFDMKVDWTYFLGYRFAIFDFATEALGGSVNVRRFELATP